MAILRLLTTRGTPRRLRMMAMMNVLACCFVSVMTLLTSFMGYFVITPRISQDERTLKAHRIAIIYMFINVCGNFILCVRIDTSAARVGGGRSKHSAATAKSKPSVSVKCGKNVSGVTTCGSTGGRGSGDLSRDVRVRTQESSAVDDGGDDSACSSSNHSRSQISSRRLDTSGNPKTDQHNLEIDVRSPSHSTSQGVDVREESHSTQANVANSRTNEKQPNARTNAPKSSGTSAPNSSSTSAPKFGKSTGKPERSHECKLCEKTILRRDHHCFFMTVCIGYHNHKHFIFFCLYMMLGALYGVIITARYLHVVYNVRFWGPQTFVILIVQLTHNMLFKRMVPTPFFSLLLYELYICLAVGLVAAGFLYWHLAITVNGQTTHEASIGDIRYRRRLTHNLRDVLGRCWLLLFLLPLPLPQAGDGRRYRPAPSPSPADNDDNTAASGLAKRDSTSENQTKSAKNSRNRGAHSSSATHNATRSGSAKEERPSTNGEKAKICSSADSEDFSVDDSVTAKSCDAGVYVTGRSDVRAGRQGAGRVGRRRSRKT